MLKKRFDTVLSLFTKRFTGNPNVVGILACGSYAHSTLHKNSDLDVFIVLQSSKKRERGNTWINGIEVEYFINPVAQIRSYFKTEKDPHTAHILATGKVVYEKGNTLSTLIKEGKNILARKPKKLSHTQKELLRYNIDDMHKDLDDAYHIKNSFIFHETANRLLSKLLSSWYAFHRIHDDKPKRLLPLLRKHDPRFGTLYNKALCSTTLKARFQALSSLVRYHEKQLGGKRPKEWKLRSKCTT